MRSMRASDKGDREPQSAIEFEAQLIARLQALVGPTTAELRNLRREFSRRLAKAPDALVLELALRLLARQQFSLRFLLFATDFRDCAALAPQHGQATNASLARVVVERIGL